MIQNRFLNNRHINPFIWNVFLTILVVSARGGDTLTLNDAGYFESRGLDVLVFENQYNGMFFDEKTAGILLIHHGVRTATGGAVRLKPTPEQWDQIPKVIERNVNKETNSIQVLLRYEEYNFDSRIKVRPEGNCFLVTVTLDTILPKKLESRAGFNLEFLPAAYFEKTYLMDDRTGIFPLYPSGTMNVMDMSTQIRQYSGHSTFDDRGRSEYVEPKAIARGKTLILAPEDPERRIKIESTYDSLMLLDGRNVAQNGWYVVRTLIPSNKTGKVIEWRIEASTIPNWIRPPMIGYSQVGYLPDQEKTAVIELDKHDIPPETASLLRLDDDGRWIEFFSDSLHNCGPYLRYKYFRFDFSQADKPGLYRIQYGKQVTGTFPIDENVYEHLWQPTLDIWFPVQMDHMFVNEAYRVWHGAAHLDDARQAPVNHQHFDGYRMGDSTETRYKPGEHIPGLNIGGWFDAGDYDIRTGSHCNTVSHLVDAWEQFGIKRDETLVDREQRYVDIHHPDGIPDIIQQIEQGTLALIAQHRAFGRAIPGIIVPNLHQYHHLGDGSTMTDNLPYNPDLKPYESNGVSSGTADDRWAFTNKSSMNNYSSISALAAASRALRGFNNALAGECLATAQKAWIAERSQPAQEGRRGFGFAGFGEMRAALQLYITTGDKQYADKFEELLWPGMDRGLNWNIGMAVQAIPAMDKTYKDKLLPYVRKYQSFNDNLLTQNPFGVPISTGGWAGNSGVINWAITNYLLHKAYPDIIDQACTYRGIAYIFGCHPGSNISFVSGIGVHSKKVAYGNNRADYSFIAGGVVPGVLVLKPDFPENKEDWPFLWGENEYVIDICAAYIFLANAVQRLGCETK